MHELKLIHVFAWISRMESNRWDRTQLSLESWRLERALVKRLLSQGYKVNRLSNTFKKFYGRHTDLVGQYKKNVCQMFADSISWNDLIFYFDGFANGQIDKIS